MRKPTTPADLGFTARDRRQLSHALADTPQARVFRRLQAVLLMAQGHTAQASAQITGLSLPSVYVVSDRAMSILKRNRTGHRKKGDYPPIEADAGPGSAAGRRRNHLAVIPGLTSGLGNAR